MARKSSTPGSPAAAAQVGAADPERRNSPLASDPEEQFELLREQVGDEAGCCEFNDTRHPDGAEVLSGSTRLRCERGIWVEVGARKP